MRQVVGGFQRAVGAAHGLVDIAGVAHHFSGFERGGLQLLAVGNRVVAGVRAIVPFDFQRIAPLDRCPSVAGHHCDAAQGLKLRGQGTALDLDDLDHPRHFHRRTAIEALDLAAVHRRPGNGGEQHAIEMHVGAVYRATVDDVVAIDGLGAFLADIAKFRGLLESQAVPCRHGQGAGSCGQGAILQLTPGRLVDDFMQLGMAFAHRHFPLVGGGLFEHGPRGGTAATHRLVPVAHAARTVGVLVAEAHFIARRLLHLDPRPIGFQFIGHHHGQAGPYALAHFRTVAHHCHRAISADAHIHLGIVDPAVRHAVGTELFLRFFGKCVLPAPARGDHQCTGGAHTLEKTTPTEVAQGEIIG
ncbi:hypothetical protein D3C76_761230 [compost metagenome]